MKIRMGFVSNSSTSSFCIYGCEIEKEELHKLFTDNGITFEEDEDGYVDYGELEEKIAKKLNGCEVIDDGECEMLWIGREWASIKDDETGKQFKESVEKILPGKKCETIQEEIAC